MTPDFRKADPGDIEVLIVMMRQLYASHGLLLPEEKSRRGTLLLMREPQAGTVWMVQSEGAPIGYAVLTNGFSLEFGGWHGFIDELFVEVSHRGAGVGTAAVHFLEAECLRQGMTTLLLEADLANERATCLYRRLGFREHSRRLMRLEASLRGAFEKSIVSSELR